MHRTTLFSCSRVWIVALILSSILFLLAWWSFNFPLTYCDSVGWAPHYFNKLKSVTPAFNTWSRGFTPVVGFYYISGQLSLYFHIGNFLGAVQAVMLCLAAVLISSIFIREARLVDILLMPGLLLCFLRLSIYSQTIYSEPLTVFLSLLVVFLVLKEQMNRWELVVGTIISVLLFEAKTDMLAMVLVFLLKILLEENARRERAIRAFSFLLLFITGTIVCDFVKNKGPEVPAAAKHLIIAEWARYTRPPENALAKVLYFDPVERAITSGASERMRTIYDGLGIGRAVNPPGKIISWGGVVRFLIYQMANNLKAVVSDRLRALHDFYFTIAAAYIADFKHKSSYYSPYNQVFSRWSVEDFDNARYSCPQFAQRQAAEFGVPTVRSKWAVGILHRLHSISYYYAQYILVAICWLAIPFSLFLLFLKRGSSQYYFLSLALAINLFERSLLIASDERYELGFDLILYWWLVLTLRGSIPLLGKLFTYFKRSLPSIC